MSNNANEFDPPILGRLVWGSLYEPRTKDFDGNPLIIKKGQDAGKPTQRFEFGLAVAKTHAHFSNEPGWGQLIWATAHAAFPGGERSPAMSPDFSWKITDGDSTVVTPKSKTKVPPCQREGYPGNWILTFSSSYAPDIFDARDLGRIVPLEGKDAIVPGYVVLVSGSVAGNTGNSPGVYINHRAVALRAYLPIIKSAGAFDTSQFAKASTALPAGATTIPTGSAPLPAAAPATAPPAAPAAPAAPAPMAVVPKPALMGIPPAAPAPAAPPAPAAEPMHKGYAVSAYLAKGWTIEQLRADGYAG